MTDLHRLPIEGFSATLIIFKIHCPDIIYNWIILVFFFTVDFFSF